MKLDPCRFSIPRNAPKSHESSLSFLSAYCSRPSDCPLRGRSSKGLLVVIVVVVVVVVVVVAVRLLVVVIVPVLVVVESERKTLKHRFTLCLYL
ncbi:hypothetical protein ElyMa_006435900 [Elysia marginata]|uniref:Uncharacterized protein n=1 Tax=Elysia marginata TaxID=1093978 RepID=A0AAV4HYQ4_9GAST|nr:hypothetical protein ElyMa_006435900 [Elysia marginata]